MKRLIATTVLIVALLLANQYQAKAGFWDWVKKFVTLKYGNPGCPRSAGLCLSFPILVDESNALDEIEISVDDGIVGLRILDTDLTPPNDSLFKMDSDVYLDSTDAAHFGYTSVKMKAGFYPIDYSQISYPKGVVMIDAETLK